MWLLSLAGPSSLSLRFSVTVFLPPSWEFWLQIPLLLTQSCFPCVVVLWLMSGRPTSCMCSKGPISLHVVSPAVTVPSMLVTLITRLNK